MKHLCQAYFIFLVLLFQMKVVAQTVQTYPTSCAGNVDVTATPPSCHDGDDGSIELVLTEDGGTAEIDWIQLPPTAISDADGSYGLSPGIYRVQISDGASCMDTLAIQLANPPRLVQMDIAEEDVRCKDEQNGIIHLSASDQSKVHKYYLNGVPKDANVNRFENLSPGFYTIHIEDVDGCIEERHAEIFEPERLELRVQKQDVSCPGAADGKFFLGAEGGVGNYKFSLDGQQFHNVLAFNDLEPRGYDVYVKDNNQCITQRSFTIKEPVEPEINFETQDVTCPGGSDAEFIVIIETVGLMQGEEYEYSLDAINYQSDSTFKDLRAGVHEVFARNNNGCVSSAEVFISEPVQPELHFEKEDVTCPGGADARFIVIIETVGLAEEQDYEYSLDDDNYQADSLFENLSAGIYTVFARNQQGCVESAAIIIEEPELEKVSFEKEDVSCPGGTDGSFIVIIETVGFQSSGPYSYSLDGIHYQTDSLFENLSAGIYEVFIRNANNCIQSIYITIEEPDLPSVELIIDPLTCPGSQNARLLINVNQGVANDNYTYSLDGFDYQAENEFTMLGSGIYTAYLKDANGCIYQELVVVSEPDAPEFELEGEAVACTGGATARITVWVSTGNAPFSYSLDNEVYQSQPYFDSLSAGMYTVFLKDANACIFSSTIQIEESNPLQNQFNVNAATCGYANGYISAQISGGTPSYNYLWSTGNQSALLNGVEAGNYALTVTDAAGCTLVQSIQLSNIDGPQLQGVTSDVSCYQMSNGAIDLQITTQAPVEQIRWSTGEVQEDLLALKSGDYAVTVIDANQCSNSMHFTINEPEEMQIAGEIEAEGNSGYLALEVSGGTAPYSYAWSTGSNEPEILQVLPGNYTVTVTDEKGCAASRFYTFTPAIDQDLGDNVTIYPVPAQQDLHIRFELPGEEIVKVQLYDELGRLVLIVPPASLINEVLTLEISALPAAIYFLHMVVGEETITRKIVVARE